MEFTIYHSEVRHGPVLGQVAEILVIERVRQGLGLAIDGTHQGLQGFTMGHLMPEST
jgi:hypothetical protein